jgi:hypothetical protein
MAATATTDNYTKPGTALTIPAGNQAGFITIPAGQLSQTGPLTLTPGDALLAEGPERMEVTGNPEPI